MGATSDVSAEASTGVAHTGGPPPIAESSRTSLLTSLPSGARVAEILQIPSNGKESTRASSSGRRRGSSMDSMSQEMQVVKLLSGFKQQQERERAEASPRGKNATCR